MYPRPVNSSDSWARDWRIIRSHSTLHIATLLLVSDQSKLFENQLFFLVLQEDVNRQ